MLLAFSSPFGWTAEAAMSRAVTSEPADLSKVATLYQYRLHGLAQSASASPSPTTLLSYPLSLVFCPAGYVIIRLEESELDQRSLVYLLLGRTVISKTKGPQLLVTFEKFKNGLLNGPTVVISQSLDTSNCHFVVP